ncbi:MAG TPA: hypothetical protein VEW46_22045 [Pyrinomonadaceae bacterium]|nr:hypothetical protein [Pyrinomonadaceae bacterium]
MYSFRRKLLPLVGGMVFVILLTACPKKVPNIVRKVVPGASGESKLAVRFHVSPTANKKHPVAVDLVFVSDKKLLEELKKMTAREWFESRKQVQLDYPKEINLLAGSWEWSPGQFVEPQCLPVKLEITGGLVFARYFNDGPHRAVINPRKDVLITLGDDSLSVQSAKTAAKPCPQLKK